jgi:hypothetical protein
VKLAFIGRCVVSLVSGDVRGVRAREQGADCFGLCFKMLTRITCNFRLHGWICPSSNGCWTCRSDLGIFPLCDASKRSSSGYPRPWSTLAYAGYCGYHWCDLNSTELLFFTRTTDDIVISNRNSRPHSPW